MDTADLNRSMGVSAFSAVTNSYFHKLQGLARLGELEPVFHPIVPMPWTADTEVIYEVLARIRARDGLVMQPREFVGTSGLSVNDLDYIMLRMLPELILATGGRTLSLNASPHTVCDDAYFDTLRSMLTAKEIHPEQFMLEVTEDALSDYDDELVILDRIDELRAMGLRIALDEFGDGGNGIRRLTNCHFDMVKISNSIDISTPRGLVLGECLVDALNRLSGPEYVEAGRTISVCFEMLETPAQVAQANYLGASYAQGFVICQPSRELPDFESLSERISSLIAAFIRLHD